MHNYFATWLGGVNVHLTDDVARSRWAAVEALVGWATDSGKAVRLSSAAVAVASISAEQRQEIAQVLQGGDASFSMMDNDAELQVLAASAVVQLFKDEGAVADAAALSVATGAFGGREPEGTPDLSSLAHNYLNARAVNARNSIEFFRNIGRLPMESAMAIWYRDEAGNTSEYASHFSSAGGESWTDEYWERFYHDIASKTKHWEHEGESRLILHGLLEGELTKSERLLTYDFTSLEGIILGIRTSDEDRIRIIDIVRRKCLENNRREFKFFQAFYSPEHGEIKSHALDIGIAGNH